MPRKETEFGEVLTRGFRQILRRPPSSRELRAFSRYLTLLLQWNRGHRLTGYRTATEIAEKLFLDSLLFLRWVPAGNVKGLDLGAGAGIPGLPLKIVEPRIDLTLLEARRRKVSFLAAVVRELELERVSVLEGRAETLVHSEPHLRDAFDVVVTRAVGPVGVLLPVVLAFLKPGGRFVMSGPPLEKPTPPLPADISGRWEGVPAWGGRPQRRFLIIEKTC